MIYFTKQEYTDINGTGKRPICYKHKPVGVISRKELIKRVASHDSKYNEGDVGAVLSQIEAEITELLLDGYALNVEGLARVKLGLGVKDGKEKESVEDDENRHNSQSVELKSINVNVHKSFLSKIAAKAKFSYAGTNLHFEQQYSREQRLGMLMDFLREKHCVHVPEYAELVGISRTQASTELREFASDPQSGIVSNGKRTTLVYTLA